MTRADRTPPGGDFERKLGEELVALATARGATATARGATATARGALATARGALATARGATAAAPSPRRSVLRRRPLLAAVMVGVAAVATALVLPAALGGARGGNGAYAVTREADGTIALELRDPAGLPGLVATLEKYGVRAAGIEAAHTEGECPLPHPKGTTARANRTSAGDSPTTVRIDPALVPPGSTVLLTAWSEQPTGVTAFSALVVDSVPACVPPPVHAPVSATRTPAPASATPTPDAGSVAAAG